MWTKAKKLIALTLICTFSSTTSYTPLAKAQNPISHSAIYQDGVRISSLANDINIPDSLGLIDKRFPLEGPTVIHIQDAHGSYDAQINIKKIIDHLSREQNIDLLLLEGGVGKIDSKYIQFFNDSKLALASADSFAKKGIVGGA